MKVGRSAGLKELNAGLGAARGISPQGLCIAKKVEVCVCVCVCVCCYDRQKQEARGHQSLREAKINRCSSTLGT